MEFTRPVIVSCQGLQHRLCHVMNTNERRGYVCLSLCLSVCTITFEQNDHVARRGVLSRSRDFSQSFLSSRFFSIKPRDWLRRTSPKWPILCRVGRETLTQFLIPCRQFVEHSTKFDGINECFQGRLDKLGRILLYIRFRRFQDNKPNGHSSLNSRAKDKDKGKDNLSEHASIQYWNILFSRLYRATLR